MTLLDKKSDGTYKLSNVQVLLSQLGTWVTTPLLVIISGYFFSTFIICYKI